jgi:hypothetical protein
MINTQIAYHMSISRIVHIILTCTILASCGYSNKVYKNYLHYCRSMGAAIVKNTSGVGSYFDETGAGCDQDCYTALFLKKVTRVEMDFNFDYFSKNKAVTPNFDAESVVPSRDGRYEVVFNHDPDECKTSIRNSNHCVIFRAIMKPISIYRLNKKYISKKNKYSKFVARSWRLWNSVDDTMVIAGSEAMFSGVRGLFGLPKGLEPGVERETCGNSNGFHL